MTDTAILAENLIKTFRKTNTTRSNGTHKGFLAAFRPKGVATRVLDEVSLEVRRGEIYGVLGPNGSGKSTLIRIISTLLIPDSGHVHVFGYDTVHEPLAVQRLINRVSADAAFFRKLSAMENLVHTARLYGLSAGDSRVRIRQILERLALSKEKMDAEMHELSRGMQQKVALARAFLTSPVLLLLDEPTTGLDLTSRREVQNFVQEIKHTHDATILLTTHDMLEAEALCDRIAIIDQGKLVTVGTSEEIIQAARKGSSELAGREKVSLEDAFVALTGHALHVEGEEVHE